MRACVRVRVSACARESERVCAYVRVKVSAYARESARMRVRVRVCACE